MNLMRLIILDKTFNTDIVALIKSEDPFIMKFMINNVPCW